MSIGCGIDLSAIQPKCEDLPVTEYELSPPHHFVFHPFNSVIQIAVEAVEIAAEFNIQLIKARELPRKAKKRAKKAALNKAMSICLTEKYRELTANGQP